MKTLVGDKVVVMKDADGVDGKVIVAEGTLSLVDTGRRTEDRRAKAEEGPCPPDVQVAATGWVVVDCDGSLQSFPAKSVKLDTVAVRQSSALVELQLTKMREEAARTKSEEEAALTFCANRGLDTSTLTPKNALLIKELLVKSVLGP